MPTYDYVCDACEHAFEQFQSITAPVMRKCPKCGKQKLRRLIGTGAAIMFKGSGFYKTDYRSDAYKKHAESDKPTTSDKSETKADTKSDAKSSKSDSTGGNSAPPKKSSAKDKK